MRYRTTIRTFPIIQAPIADPIDTEPAKSCSTCREIDIGDDGLRLEDDTVPVDISLCTVPELLDEVRDVVGQTEKVLLIGVWPGLAGDLQLVDLILDGAASLDREQVGIRDAVEEYDTAVDLELLRRLA